jgi:hypothetical protein
MYTSRGCMQGISTLINMAEISITTENKNINLCIRLNQTDVNRIIVRLQRILDLRKKIRKKLTAFFPILPYDIVQKQSNTSSIVIPGSAIGWRHCG